MGVSIFVYLETFRDGGWRFEGRVVPNPEHDYDPDEPEAAPEPFFESFEKELAAVLTGRGLRIRSDEDYVPVAPGRGLPPDLSPELEAFLPRHEGEAGFSANWFTGRELLDFGWEQRTMRRVAMVEPRVARLFSGDRRGFPFSEWPKGVPISFAEYLKGGVRVEWTETYADIARGFHDEVLPKVRQVGPPDDLRIVVAAYW
jgi:hypothetical protein